MKVIMIGGYPGVGKSTIVRRFISLLEKSGFHFEERKDGMITYMDSPNLIILGSYAKDEKFPGTDRLPMNVQPQVERFLDKHDWSAVTQSFTVLMEGDRLFNDKMLKYVTEKIHAKLCICIVKAEMSLVKDRREARSEQDETWRKGRETKVNRIEMSYPIAHILFNNTKEEQEKSAEELMLEFTGKWDRPAIHNLRDMFK